MIGARRSVQKRFWGARDMIIKWALIDCVDTSGRPSYKVAANKVVIDLKIQSLAKKIGYSVI